MMSNIKWDKTLNGIEDAPEDFVDAMTERLLQQFPDKKKEILETQLEMKKGVLDIVKRNKGKDATY